MKIQTLKLQMLENLKPLVDFFSSISQNFISLKQKVNFSTIEIHLAIVNNSEMNMGVEISL